MMNAAFEDTLYRAALAKIFPAKRIASALVWTEGPALMALPDGLLDAQIAAICARARAELDPLGGRS